MESKREEIEIRECHVEKFKQQGMETDVSRSLNRLCLIKKNPPSPVGDFCSPPPPHEE